jgi:hypothetical protein
MDRGAFVMSNLQDRKASQTEEFFEFPITGPFGGIQSELPLDQIENYGFADTTNMLFRKGVCYLRPGFTLLTPFPVTANEPVMGIADFFNKNGVRIQVVFTPTRLLRWNSLTADWTEITGPGFTGAATDTFTWDVIGNKLCFSQGKDKIFYWDGITPNYIQTSVSAPAALFIAEIGLHLMALYCDIGGGPLTQTYMWSGAGDPTDWTSFNSGRNDNLNNLGPGRGLLKLGQYGYGWHNWGIVQIQPTGIGVAPFYFTPIANSNVGNISIRSLTRFNREGVECAAYLGKDNVYIFNQSSVIPIGDAPIDGRKRLGARSRILADLVSSNALDSFGFVTQNIVGNVFNAYWLIIPNVAVWCYNFDESNWTRFQYNGKQTVAGLFFWQRGIRIMDLIGTIAQQNWTPATLNPNLLFDGFAIGYDNGQIGFIDFTNYSEIAGQVVSGKHIFTDRRHGHAVKKFRLVVQDNGPATYTVTVRNNLGYQETKSVTLGTGSGDSISYVFAFNVSGLRITWSCSVPATQPGAIIEFCPMFTVTGEQRGGMID